MPSNKSQISFFSKEWDVVDLDMAEKHIFCLDTMKTCIPPSAEVLFLDSEDRIVFHHCRSIIISPNQTIAEILKKVDPEKSISKMVLISGGKISLYAPIEETLWDVAFRHYCRGGASQED